jgi:protein-S-isoprenylcysteine O-methyltransferase Ste14
MHNLVPCGLGLLTMGVFAVGTAMLFSRGTGVSLTMRALLLTSLAGIASQTATLALAPSLGQIRIAALVSLYTASWLLYATALAVAGIGRFSLAFSADIPQDLVTTGPYRYVRHPIYSAYLLAWIAPCAALPQAGTLVPFAVLAIFYWCAAALEERKFERSPLADSYLAYREMAGRFLPRLIRPLKAFLSSDMGAPLLARIATSEVDRSAVLRMRTENYRAAGKHTATGVMKDKFDDSAVLLSVWANERVVASARLLVRDPTICFWQIFMPAWLAGGSLL